MNSIEVNMHTGQWVRHTAETLAVRIQALARTRGYATSSQTTMVRRALDGTLPHDAFTGVWFRRPGPEHFDVPDAVLGVKL